LLNILFLSNLPAVFQALPFTSFLKAGKQHRLSSLAVYFTTFSQHNSLTALHHNEMPATET